MDWQDEITGTPDVPAVKSAARVLDLLDDIAVNGPATRAQLSLRMGIPKSSIHAVLRTMISREWLELDHAGGAYRLGFRSLVVSSAFLECDPATGTVELSRAGTVLARATVAQGRATLALPARVLPPGTYDLALRYGGDATHAASSSTLTVTVVAVPVTKSSSKTVAKLKPTKASFGEDFKVIAKVRATMAQSGTPTGKVKVRIDGRLAAKGRLTDGRYVMNLKRNLEVGKHMLLVTYLGDSATTRSKDRVKFRVVR